MAAPAAAPRAAKPASRLWRWARALALSAVVAVGSLSLSGSPVRADAPPPAAAAAKAEAPAAKVAIRAEVSPQDILVGERQTLTLTVTNEGTAPVSLPPLRQALIAGAPATLEVQPGPAGNEPVTLAPGESRTAVFEVIPWDSGALTLDLRLRDPKVPLPAQAGQAQEAAPEDPGLLGAEPIVFKVRSTLTPDWREKGFRDIAEIETVRTPNMLLWLTVPLVLLLGAAAERYFASRRAGRKPTVHGLPALEAARRRVAELEAGLTTLPAEDFYHQAFEIVHLLTVDWAGLPKKQRGAKELAEDLAASDRFTSVQRDLAGRLARMAEERRYAGRAEDEASRGRILTGLKSLLEDLAEPQEAPAGRSAPALALLAAGGAAGFSFAHPAALALFIPLGLLTLFLIWRARRGAASAHRMSETQSLPPAKSLRQRLRWLPAGLQALAAALVLIAAAGPQGELKRSEVYVPSTETIFMFDGSGSMGGQFGDMTRIQASAAAGRAYVLEQRRGTTNRIGIGMFENEAAMEERLTGDHDALIGRLKELSATGSTAVGRSIVESALHFLDINARELSRDKDDPRLQELASYFKNKDISTERRLILILEFAKKNPDLWEKIRRPDEPKVVVLFTDGESNTGVSVPDAVKMVQHLDMNVRLYAVGIGTSGQYEQTLKKVTSDTGGFYRSVESPAGLREMLLEISSLERRPAIDRTSVQREEYWLPFLIAAALLFGASVSLRETKLRTLHGLALFLALGVPAAPVSAPAPGQAPIPVLAQADAHVPRGLADQLGATLVPRLLKEANDLYFQGRYVEATKKYNEAAQAHPEIAEIHFNLGNAWLRQGDVERAAKSYEEFLARNPDPKAASRVRYNLGNAAIMQRDLGTAIRLYREALKADVRNADARWNLEVAMKLLQQQQQQGQQGQQGQPQPGQGQPQPGQGQPQPGQGQPQPGQGQPQPGQGQGEGQNPLGDPQDGEGQQQGRPGEGQGQGRPRPSQAQQNQAIDELIRELERADQARGSGQGGRNAVPRSGDRSAWGIAAVPLLAAAGGGLASSWPVFTNPLLMWALLAVLPLLALFLIYSVVKRLRAARALSKNAPKRFRDWNGKGRWLNRFFLTLAAWTGFALAAGQPIIGTAVQRLSLGGVDALLTVDMSASARYAEDGRYARTLDGAGAFLERIEGADRVGVVVFATRGRTAAFLSYDPDVPLYALERMDRQILRLGGTGSNLPAGVEEAAKVFRNAKKIGDRERVLILFTDGDVEPEQIAQAARILKDNKIKPFIIGVGEPGGSKIAVPRPDGSGVDYLQDNRTGQPAITKLDEANLLRLAQETGGEYLPAYKYGKGAAATETVLREIARRQEGASQETAVLSPKPVHDWFLWPSLAFLVLGLLLREKSMLGGAPATRPKEDGEGETLGGFALLGAAGLGGLLPLSAGPAVLVAALVALPLVLLLFYEVATRGALSRALRARLEGASLRRALARDLGVLFDNEDTAGAERFREAELKALREFLDRWRKAEPGERPALAEEAAQDGLWRQKLAAAYLWEAAQAAKGSEERQDRILGLLRGARRAQPQAMDAVARRLIARRGELGWLNHPRMLRALARLAIQDVDASKAESRAVLEKLAAERDPEVSRPAAAALGRGRPRRSRASWIGMGLMTVALAGTLGAAGWGGLATVELKRERAAAHETLARNFWGDHDYIRNPNQYIDHNIPRVLGVLEDWWRDDERAQARMLEALKTLRKSHDPKADNILEAIFDRFSVTDPSLLPVSSEAEALLLKTLVERENEKVWDFLQAYMERNAQNPHAGPRLLRMIDMVADSGNPKIFHHLFHFLASPNDEVRARAGEKILASLGDPARSQEHAQRLLQISNQLKKYPELQLWVLHFALERLAQPGAEDLPLQPYDFLIVQALSHGINGGDVQRFQAAPRVQPGQERRGLPAPWLERALAVQQAALARSAQAEGGVPDPQALAVQGEAAPIVNGLLAEGFHHAPGLEERLTKAGLMEDADPASRLPHRYDLRDIRAVRDLVAAEAAATAKPTPPQREYFDRADRVLVRLHALAQAAGLREGGRPGDLAADEANAAVQRANSSLFSRLPELLADLGTAPKAQVVDWRSMPQTYDRAQLDALRAALESIRESGTIRNHQNQEVSLSWYQKVALAETIERVAAAAEKHFPGQGEASPTVGQRLKALEAALAASDAARAAEIEKALRDAYAAAGDKVGFLAQLQAGRERRSGQVQLWVLRFAGEARGDLSTQGQSNVQPLLHEAFAKAVKEGLETEAWEALGESGDAVLVQQRVNLRAKELAKQAYGRLAIEERKPFEERLHAAYVLQHRHHSYSTSFESKLRSDFLPYHLRELKAAVAAVERHDKAWTDFVAETSRMIESMEKAAKAAGIRDGGSSLERTAERINEVLEETSYKVTNSSPYHFWGHLQKKDLAGPYNRPLDSYTAEQVVALIEVYRDILKRDKGFGHYGQRPPLGYAQRQHVVEALERLGLLAHRHFPAAALSETPLSVRIAEAAGGDAAARKALDAAVAEAAKDGTLLLRLKAAQKAARGDAALQRAVLDAVLAALSRTDGSGLLTAGGVELIGDVTRELGREEVRRRISEALAADPEAAGLREMGRTLVGEGVRDLIEKAEKAYPGLKDEIVREGLRSSPWGHRASFKLKDLTALDRVIEERATAEAGKGPLSAEQEAAREAARRELPELKSLGEAAGLLPGDSPGEAAAAKLNPALHQAYKVLPGRAFIEALRGSKLAPEGSADPYSYSVDLDSSYEQTYSKEALERMRDFLKDFLEKDAVPNYVGASRKMNERERQAVEAALKTAEELLENYPQPAPEPEEEAPAEAAKEDAQTASLFSMAPLALLGAAPLAQAAPAQGAEGVGALAVFAVAAAAAWALLQAFGWVLGMLSRRGAPASARREEVPTSVEERVDMLDAASRKLANAATFGETRSRRIAESGSEFGDLSPYQDGDDIRRVNWKASATLDDGNYMVNRYEPPRDMPFIVLLDLSASGETKRAAAEDAAALIAMAAAKTNRPVEAVLFADGVEAHLKAGRSAGQARELAREILSYVPKSRGTNMKGALEFVRERLKSRGTVVVVSDFQAAGFEDVLSDLADNHDLRAVRVVDPAELKPLPTGELVAVEDAETGARRWVDGRAARRDHARALFEREARLEEAFAAAGTRPITLSTDRSYLDDLIQEFPGT